MQPMSGRFVGSVVLVTGAAHGIGRACAIRLATEGARVVVADLDERVADEVAQQLPGRGHRAAIPHLRRSARGPAIVNVSSVNGLTALGSEPYSSAKAGLVSLTANLALTLGPEQIRVNGVAPGTVRTRVWDDQEGGPERLRPMYPLGRVGEPEDVAAAVAFLASSDAAWITGHTLPVDGGLLTNH